MSALLALWDLSVALAAAALLALLALIVARALSERRAAVRQRIRRDVTKAMLAGDAVLERPTALQREIAADVTLELAELVRGSDRERLLGNAQALGVVEVLRRRLSSALAQDRLTAAEALAMFPGEIGKEALVALDDRNAQVRLGAALALAHNHIAPTAAELVRKLGIGTTERSLLAVSLMRDLVETDPRGVEAMLYEDHLSDEAKLAAIDALASSGMVEHAPLVAWMASAAKNQPHLQPRVFRALGRLGHPGAREPILEGLHSADRDVRSAAAEAAGRIGLTDAIEPLRQLLADEQWSTRFRSAEALVRLGLAGRETLALAAESGPPRARQAACAMLAESGRA